MTKLQAALLDLAAFLDERRLRYMVIGGFANLHWGLERFTRDIDIIVEVAEQALPGLLDDLGRMFRFTTDDPLEFARRNRLVRVQTQTAVDADLILASLPYDLSALRRAVPVAIGDRTVMISSAEDLIIHKLTSERLQDAADAEGIVVRQAGRLDLEYLRPRVKELALGLERPEIEAFFSRLLETVDRGRHG